MKLIFRGHDDRYAIEQSLLAFFPEERPVYETAEAGEDDCAYVSLTEGKRYATGVTSIHYHGKTARGVSRAVLTDAPDEYERERLRQRALKLSFFKAARDITGVTPSWGALTGIRPGKLARAMLEQGKTERETDRVLRDTYFVSPERRRLAIETARAGLKAKRDLRPDEISLYVGIPFCPTRCAYCSFVSASVEKSFGLMEPYLASLEQEITDAARMVAETGLRIKSFYMGGGTPTTLSARQMDHLLTHLNRSFDLTDCAEYCIEAGRPDTIDREKLQVLLDHGADRISVNPQSLDDNVLRAIGRRHSATDILAAMELATSMGFPHVNMDLIAGLPVHTAIAMALVSGIVMAICTMKGYELLGGKLTKKGVIISVVIMIVMTYVGDRVDWAIMIARELETDVFYGYRLLPLLLSEEVIDMTSYVLELVLLYALLLVGAIPTIQNAMRKDKVAGTICKL